MPYKHQFFHISYYQFSGRNPKEIEELLSNNNLRFVCLTEPDGDMLGSQADQITSNYVTIIELRDNLRTFYIVQSETPIILEDAIISLHFSAWSRGGLESLFRLIGSRQIRGLRYKYRSPALFLLSIVVGMTSPFLFNIKSLQAQIFTAIIVTLIIYFIIDWPFSLLMFKGISIENVPKKILRF